MPNKLKGIGIGNGIAIAKAYVLKEPEFVIDNAKNKDIAQETKSFEESHKECIKQIEKLIEQTEKNISKDKADIFRAHLEITKDDAIISDVKNLISEKHSAAYAVKTVFDKYAETFSQMEDKYFSERATDLRDIQKRILTIVCKIETFDLLLINEECVIVAEDLTPSETSLLNKKYVKACITDIGGATSHTAIMAKTLGIPAIVSLKNASTSIQNGDFVAVNCNSGEIEFQLSPSEVKEWENKKIQYEKYLSELDSYKTLECKTLDSQKINLMGNIGKPKDLDKVIENGGKGVGLFRSEFLYMESSNWPTEDEQFEAYKAALSGVAKDEYVTIRTLDIGGDKHLDYYSFPKEMNPFLGYRALRMTLHQKDIFTVQLRALLRASVHGNLKIMFPMVTTVDEFEDAKHLTLQIQKQLEKEGVPISKNIAIGMMIETPSSALLAEQFAQIANFFSIGSNDLIQYTHAVDRMSEEINYLYQPNSPSVLKLISMSAIAAQKHNIPISVCGEMASNVMSIPILLGLGIKHLSMSAGSLTSAKKVINGIKLSDCQKLAETALASKNEKEVNQLVDKFLKDHKLKI